MKTIKERLADWTDWDIAGYELGAVMGFSPEAGWNFEHEHPKDPWNGYKGVLWSNHPLGEYLYKKLNELVIIGILEKRDEPDTQYRVNLNFNISIF